MVLCPLWVEAAVSQTVVKIVVIPSSAGTGIVTSTIGKVLVTAPLATVSYTVTGSWVTWTCWIAVALALVVADGVTNFVTV